MIFPLKSPWKIIGFPSPGPDALEDSGAGRAVEFWWPSWMVFLENSRYFLDGLCMVNLWLIYG